jgi:hypothetical protein
VVAYQLEEEEGVDWIDALTENVADRLPLPTSYHDDFGVGFFQRLLGDRSELSYILLA